MEGCGSVWGKEVGQQFTSVAMNLTYQSVAMQACLAT
jgi:hypothetical protein